MNDFDDIKPIGYTECSDALLKLWIDNILTDGEYYKIMDRLNTKYMLESCKEKLTCQQV